MNVAQRFVVVLVTITCLVLVVVLLLHDFSTTRGHYVYALDDPDYQQPCGDRLTIVLKLRDDGQAAINETVLPRGAVSQRMQQIFAERCERALFLEADSNVPSQDVAAQVDALQSQIAYLNIALVTRHEQVTNGCGPDIRHWQELQLPDCNSKTTRTSRK